MKDADRNWIYKNLIIGNRKGGIYNDYGDNNIIENNYVENNTAEGILLIGSNLNEFVGNSIVNNHMSGIFLQTSDNNQFHENYFHGNSYGIYLLYTADNNLIYNNTFFANLIQDALEEFSKTQWDNGVIGNSWNNYNGKDIDDNGIGDTPYYFDDSVDNYPLWWDAPVFEILNPNDDDMSSASSPEFSLNMTEGIAATVRYMFNNNSTNYTGSLNEFLDQNG